MASTGRTIRQERCRWCASLQAVVSPITAGLVVLADHAPVGTGTAYPSRQIKLAPAHAGDFSSLPIASADAKAGEHFRKHRRYAGDGCPKACWSPHYCSSASVESPAAERCGALINSKQCRRSRLRNRRWLRPHSHDAFAGRTCGLAAADGARQNGTCDFGPVYVQGMRNSLHRGQAPFSARHHSAL